MRKRLTTPKLGRYCLQITCFSRCSDVLWSLLEESKKTLYLPSPLRQVPFFISLYLVTSGYDNCSVLLFFLYLLTLKYIQYVLIWIKRTYVCNYTSQILVINWWCVCTTLHQNTSTVPSKIPWSASFAKHSDNLLANLRRQNGSSRFSLSYRLLPRRVCHVWRLFSSIRLTQHSFWRQLVGNHLPSKWVIKILALLSPNFNESLSCMTIIFVDPSDIAQSMKKFTFQSICACNVNVCKVQRPAHNFYSAPQFEISDRRRIFRTSNF